jgi:imidazolonepropionase-like amidohydrolase
VVVHIVMNAVVLPLSRVNFRSAAVPEVWSDINGDTTVRIRILFTLLAALLICAQLAAQPPQQTPAFVIIHANVIDGISDQPLRDATVFVRNGKIENVVPGSTALPAGATVIDLKGRWLLPGFEDAHVHLRDLAAARLALASGVTTARCLGVNHFVDIGIRELNHAGVSDLPDILASGYHVRPRPAEELFLDLPRLKDLMGNPVTGVENARLIVRAQIERGVNVIKVMATERAGLPDTDPRKRVFTDEEIAAVVDEARKSNIFVAAHAHGNEGAYAAVKAGVRSIEHGTWLSDETLRLMKERGTYFVPTIATVEDLIEPGGDYDNALLAIRGRAMLPRLRETAEKAWKIGIKLVAGTDTGYGPNSNRRMPDEIAALTKIGMSPMEAIKAGTSVAAECFGIAARTGAIRKGLEADLVAVERDPLADISNLRDVLLVVNNGKVVVNRLGW